MNSAIGEAILTVGSSWALSTLVKATFVTALGLWGALLAGRKRAAFRHALLAATFGVLLALPVISALAPPSRITLRRVQARNAAAPVGGRGAATAPAIAKRPDGVPAGLNLPGRPMVELLAAGWVAGMVVVLLPTVAGLWQLLRLRRSGLPWQPGQSVADGLARGAGMSRRVDVLLCEGLSGPMTCGVARPAIVLPADAANWSGGDLNRAMVHELEHVMRCDWAIHCLARAVCAVYWFHPLAWMALRRLELEAERACDDAVLENSEPTAYADQLVSIARRLSAAAKTPLPAMASRADLASRVSAVLDGQQRRGRAGALCVTVATAVAAVLAVTVSPLRMVAAPQAVSGAMPQLRTETRLVIIDAKVSFPNGNPIEGLNASDFELTEDGVPQPIRLCEFQKATGTDPNLDFYILGYYPRNGSSDAQFRKIHLIVKTVSTAKVEYRDGYYMTPPVGVAQSGVAATPLAGGAAALYDKPPVLIFKMEAEYPEEARKAKYQGTVLLDVEVDDSGQVVNLRVARSLGLGLDQKAIDAVKRWRFKPAMKDGRPIGVEVQVEVNFRLL
jgi:TonB family protein